jgi:hypothetical protein
MEKRKMKKDYFTHSKITITNGDFVNGNKNIIINNKIPNIKDTLKQINTELEKINLSSGTKQEINNELTTINKEIATKNNFDSKKLIIKINKVIKLLTANVIIDATAQKLLFLLDNLIQMFKLS